MAVHPATLHAARARMIAVATALESEDIDLIGVAVDDMDATEAMHALCYTLGAFYQVWQDWVIGNETWPQFLRRMALPRCT